MGNIITVDVTEAEHKYPKSNKYNVVDIRMELCEQFIILFLTFLLKYKFALVIWLIICILTAIKTFMIWKGQEQ